MATKKSKCVLEVERLQRQREERRAQADARKQRRQADEIRSDGVDVDYPRMIKEYKEHLKAQAAPNLFDPSESKICVCIRKRPLSAKETEKRDFDVVSCHGQQVICHEPRTKVDLSKYIDHHNMTFDKVFDDGATNKQVYESTIRPVVEYIFQNRGKATCFAYGQTGSGKTHTMVGGGGNAGVYERTTRDIFHVVSCDPYQELNLNVSVSYFEIYGPRVFDLLNNRKRLDVAESAGKKVEIVGLAEHQASSVADVLKVIEIGNAARTTGSTSANADSSRSHAVFQTVVRDGSGRVHCKFSLVDLAGSERGADTTHANRQRRVEGAEINKSLLALKECIRALDRKSSHTPFRASKLTLVLRDSFIGKYTKTVMIATISPGASAIEHTLNTVRYADRVKELSSGKKSAISPQRPNANPKVPQSNLQKSPSRGQPSRLDEEEEEDEEDHDEKEDLEYMMQQTVKQDEQTAELLRLHQSLRDIIEEEEAILRSHFAAVEENKKILLNEHKLLLATAAESEERDIEAYASKMDELLTLKINSATALRTRIQSFRGKLKTEEEASRHVKGVAYY